MWRTSFKLKQFVKATSDEERQRQNERIQRQKELKGTDVQEFYDEVISSAPQDNSLPSSSAPVARQMKKKKKLPAIKDQLYPPILSQRQLFLAAQSDQAEAVGNGLSYFKIDSVDEFGWTLLMTAACAGSLQVVQLLVESGADTTIKDKAGSTALSLAQKKNRTEVVAFLQLKDTNSENEGDIKEIEQEQKVYNIDPFKCEACDKVIVGMDESSHKASVGHQLKAGPAAPRTIYGISETNRGFQMLLNDGWNRDKGLGAKGQGKKFPVKTVLKQDRRGIGAETSKARVTHFKPNDPSSVAKPKHVRLERITTLNKRKQAEEKKKSVRRDRRLRQELDGL